MNLQWRRYVAIAFNANPPTTRSPHSPTHGLRDTSEGRSLTLK
ncbi:MAG TPA: hypothetical protein V6C84_11995 [Coleofasciculaceae cyanobacterium]